VALPDALTGPDMAQQTDVLFIGHMLPQHRALAAITAPAQNVSRALLIRLTTRNI